MHTWNHGYKFSTLDYIFGPNPVANSSPLGQIQWGINKSDHAAIIVTISYDLEKGCGMFRPCTAFLDVPELKMQFDSSLRESMADIPLHWNPHETLEFCKVMIRTLIEEYSLKFRKSVEDKHKIISDKLSCLHKLRFELSSNWHEKKYVNIGDVDLGIFNLNTELDLVLELKTKMPAARSRVKWLKFGEKSNKYFLNINKSFSNKSLVTLSFSKLKINCKLLTISTQNYTSIISVKTVSCTLVK